MTAQQDDKIKVLLADDHQVMIDGLKVLLEREPDISVVAEANNGRQVMAQLKSSAIDIVVLDIGMPEMDGYTAVLEIQNKFPNTKIIILSLFRDELNVGKMLRENIHGYIIKDKGSSEIVKAIRAVAKGDTYYDNEVQVIMRGIIKNRNAGPNKTISLSETETAVLHLLSENMSSKQIGKELCITANTVETHKRNAAQKLGLEGTSQLMPYAIRNGYNAQAYRSKKKK